jgi:hypothetical protein
LIQAAERTWPPAAVHDSVRAVLENPAFQRSLRQTLLDRMMMWLVEGLQRLLRAARHLPSGRTIVLALVALLVVFVIVRLVISARKRQGEGQRSLRRHAANVQEDPWRLADELAAAGQCAEAAHALYRGVLLSISRTDRIRLDPSRTSGDYARDLRRRGSPSASLFRAFTRRFESAVFGHEQCTPEVFAELRRLSEPFRAARARAA